MTIEKNTKNRMGQEYSAPSERWVPDTPLPHTAGGSAQYTIRPLQGSESEILKDFLYEAIFVPEGGEPPPRAIVDRPELRVYTDDFGTGPADNCLVAVSSGRVIGAVWTRIMDDYGHVDDETPSLAISLHKENRGQGIGTALMKEMLQLLRGKGYQHASLAVQKRNYAAVRMYENAGFRTVAENGEEYIMVCDLQSESDSEKCLG